MSHAFFISILILISIFRPLLSILVVVLRPFVPFFKARLDFERKNLLEESSLPFSAADYCFEVSSEGELEQVRALLEAVLRENKKIEIIYSSPSVENKCAHLYKLYPDQVRLLRLPLLSNGLFSFLYFQSIWTWVKAPVVIFCRYDFFPELLLLKLAGKKFILVSGELKKASWYKLESLKFFDTIVAATDLQKKRFSALLGSQAKLYSCDFRVPRIAQRYQQSASTLAQRPGLKNYLLKLESLAPKNKLILGSVWESDLLILKNPTLIDRVRKGELHLLLAPHKLDEAHTLGLFTICRELFGEECVEVVNDKTTYSGKSVVILQMSGILCELYALFSMSYVGGGYERSIHSVLEPFFSHNIVITGPVIKRSTEFDLAFEIAPREIHVLNRPESFYTIIESLDAASIDHNSRLKFLEKTDGEMKLIIKDILG